MNSCIRSTAASRWTEANGLSTCSSHGGRQQAIKTIYLYKRRVGFSFTLELGWGRREGENKMSLVMIPKPNTAIVEKPSTRFLPCPDARSDCQVGLVCNGNSSQLIILPYSVAVLQKTGSNVTGRNHTLGRCSYPGHTVARTRTGRE